MLQQLLHSYFQKRDKADKQGQKIQHSCCKGKWAPEVDHFHAASLTTHSEAYGGFAALILNIWNHINLHQFNFSVDWILYCIFHYFVWSLHSGFQLWQNSSSKSSVQELVKNEYHCVRDCLIHFSLGRLSRFANLKMFILHWHCLILSFPTLKNTSLDSNL